jgi:hypothetical protein
VEHVQPPEAGADDEGVDGRFFVEPVSVVLAHADPLDPNVGGAM